MAERQLCYTFFPRYKQIFRKPSQGLCFLQLRWKMQKKEHQMWWSAAELPHSRVTMVSKMVSSSYLAFGNSLIHTFLCLTATTPGLMLLFEGQMQPVLVPECVFLLNSVPSANPTRGCRERFEQQTGDRCRGLFSACATQSTSQDIWMLRKRKLWHDQFCVNIAWSKEPKVTV